MDLPLIPGTDVVDLESMVTPESKAIFETVVKNVSKKLEVAPETMEKLEKTAKETGEMPVLPQYLHLGSGFLVKTKYGSPFPSHLCKLEKVYVCDYCMEFFDGEAGIKAHNIRGCLRMPPGREIYKKGKVAVFEVNGNEQKSYCENVCLVSRLFLQTKTIVYQTEHFMFYVLAFRTRFGYQFAGYFSKEMYWPPAYTMMCLMVMPNHQSKGYGRLLIALSYAMGRREGLKNGPETPLSEDGAFAHEQYWIWSICEYLVKEETIKMIREDGICVVDIANGTGINPHDVLKTIGELKWIEFIEPPNERGVYTININMDWDFVTDTLDREMAKEYYLKRAQFDETCLKWEPRRITPPMNGFDGYKKKQEDSEKELPTIGPSTSSSLKSNQHESDEGPSTSGPPKNSHKSDDELEAPPAMPAKSRKSVNRRRRQKQHKNN